MKLVKKLFTLSNILLFVFTILCYIAPYIDPRDSWIFSFFATAYFWLLVLNVIFIIAWTLAKNKLWMLSFLALLLGVNHISSYIGVSMNHKTENGIDITTYNIGGYVIPKNQEERQKKALAFYAMLEQNGRPDILCFQESGSLNFLQRIMKYKNLRKESGISILTDLEVVDQGTIIFKKSFNELIWVDVIWDGQRVRIVNIHLQSNSISEDAEDLINNPNLKEKETWLGMRSVISKIKRATKIRTKQTFQARKFIDQSPYPVILVGDFNDTPLSYTYRTLSAGFQDGFKQKGKGLGITYAGVIPGLRIDYILASDKIKFNKYQVQKTRFSDHYPIRCNVSLRE